MTPAQLRIAEAKIEALRNGVPYAEISIERAMSALPLGMPRKPLGRVRTQRLVRNLRQAAKRLWADYTHAEKAAVFQRANESAVRQMAAASFDPAALFPEGE